MKRTTDYLMEFKMNLIWKMSVLSLSLALIAGSPAQADADPAQIDSTMKKIMEAYQAPKAFSNSASMSIEFGGEQMQEQFSTLYGADGSMEMLLPNMVIKVVDGYFYAEIEGEDKNYLKRPIGAGFESTVKSIFGTTEIIPFDCMLRSGSSSNWIQSMTFGLMQNPKVEGISPGKDPKGNDSNVMKVSSPNGMMDVFIDPKTNLVTGAQAEVSEGEGPQAMMVKLGIVMTSKVYDKLPKPITFDPGDRNAAMSIEEMLPDSKEPDVSGKLAPDFTLPLYGSDEKVTLSKLRGKIVVLDFWATWCGPCRRGLPLIQKFSDWAGENTDDVVVYAVNVWEQADTFEGVSRMVGDFWKKNKYTMPTLISMSPALTEKYGIGGIPVTLVIGKDGSVAKMHRGFSPGIFDELKADVEKLRAKD